MHERGERLVIKLGELLREVVAFLDDQRLDIAVDDARRRVVDRREQQRGAQHECGRE